MKKTYIRPELCVYELSPATMLASSDILKIQSSEDEDAVEVKEEESSIWKNMKIG